MRNNLFPHLVIFLIAVTITKLFCGCDVPPPSEQLPITPKVVQAHQVEKNERFTVSSKGTFQAGYANASREIFILKDHDTGAEYLGITDCTVIKIKQKQDEEVADAIDMMSDIISAAAE